MFGNDLSQHRGKQVSPLRPFWWLAPPPCPVGSMSYDTESKSRNILASPLGEEGHEVAKGCTRVRMIMILDVDVTAERRHYKTHCPLKGSLCIA